MMMITCQSLHKKLRGGCCISTHCVKLPAMTLRLGCTILHVGILNFASGDCKRSVTGGVMVRPHCLRVELCLYRRRRVELS